MIFEEITKEEYRKYWENHPLKTFISAPEIADLRKNTSWNSYFVAVKKNEKIEAATMLLSHKRRFNVYEFYAPRGFLMDFKNKEVLNFFVTELKKYIKSKKGFKLRIDPYVIYKERDIDGNIVENGEDNSDIVESLKELGFIKVPTKDKEQVGWMFSLDLEGKTEDDIVKGMKPNTRNTIRKAEKFGITMKELGYEELDRFQNIMEETSERKGFTTRNIEYFQNMYKLFHDKNEIKYYVTELNLKEYIKKLEKEKEEKKEKLKNLSDAKYNDAARKNFENELKSIDKRIKESEEIRKETKKDIITLSGSMFILIKPEIIYLSSGNYEEYMKFNSQYLIQWELIKYGIKNGFKKHNFYGIPENINTKPKDYGIYEFKRGFNGYVEELIGEYELPISFHYHIIKLLKKLKRNK